MILIAGPRQAGKATLPRHILSKNDSRPLYYNWDLREIQDADRADPSFFESSMRNPRSKGHVPWVCFDEIHKMPKWKNILKGLYDKFEGECRFIVTGSARLEWFRRAGDSLAGRYFLFHLNPLSLSEAAGRAHLEPEPDESAWEFIERKLHAAGHTDQALLEQLLTYSGFPEPFLRANEAHYRRWQREMVDTLTREDVRDLAKRFENSVADELKIMIDPRHDTGIGDFDLMYVRTKDGKETDFLIMRDRKPWCLFEAKLQDEEIARHHIHQARALGNVPYIQLARAENVYKKSAPGFLRVSAGRFFKIWEKKNVPD